MLYDINTQRNYYKKGEFKMVKKILSAVMCAVIMFTAYSAMFSANAASGSLALGISGVKISVQGESCSVTVTVTENPGIKSLLLKLNYDTAVLSLTSVANGSVLTGTTLVKSDMTAIPYILYWMDANNGSSATTGTLVTLNFTYKSSFKSTEITVVSAEAKDIGGNAVAVVTTNEKAVMAFKDYFGLISNVFNRIQESKIFDEVGNFFSSIVSFFKSAYNFIMDIVDLSKVLS